MQWGKFHFVKEDDAIRTDLMLYRDRSHFLLPPRGEENRFMVSADDEEIRFYIGSTSLESYSTLERFFTRLYKCYVIENEPGRIRSSNGILLSSRALSRKRHGSYSPWFIKNMIYLPSSIPDLRMDYEVVIRSSENFARGRRYNFALHLRPDYEGGTRGRVKSFIRSEVSRLRKESGWSLRISGNSKKRMRSDLFRDASSLCTFVRVPEDEGR